VFARTDPELAFRTHHFPTFLGLIQHNILIYDRVLYRTKWKPFVAENKEFLPGNCLTFGVPQSFKNPRTPGTSYSAAHILSQVTQNFTLSLTMSCPFTAWMDQRSCRNWWTCEIVLGVWCRRIYLHSLRFYPLVPIRNYARPMCQPRDRLLWFCQKAVRPLLGWNSSVSVLYPSEGVQHWRTIFYDTLWMLLSNLWQIAVLQPNYAGLCPRSECSAIPDRVRSHLAVNCCSLSLCEHVFIRRIFSEIQNPWRGWVSSFSTGLAGNPVANLCASSEASTDMDSTVSKQQQRYRFHAKAWRHRACFSI